MRGKRLCLFIAILITVFIAPWWVATIFASIVLLMYGYLEIIVIGFLFDTIYTVEGSIFEQHIFLLSASVLYILGHFLRPYLRFS